MELVNYYKRLLEFLNTLLGIKEKPNVVFAKNKKVIYNENNVSIEYIDVNAKFFTEIDTIYVNLDKHNLDNHDEIFSIIHEYRHFYQYHQIIKNTEILEDKTIIEKWKSNFDNYVNFGNEDFYKQDIEIDANAFTIFIIQKLFQRSCYINTKFDKQKVNEYFNLYEKKFTDNKIQNGLEQTKLNVFHLFKIEN